MELVVFMPTTLACHVAKHCNHVVVNSPDENNNIGSVYWLIHRSTYMKKVNDVTGWLSQTTDISKYFIWAPGL